MKKRAAGYVRVSSRDSATTGESLTTQRKAIKDFAKTQGWNLTKIYADEGISGSTVNERPGLVQLLKNAGKKNFDILVIHRLSRFGRNARDLLNNYAILVGADVQLLSIKENMDFSNPYGKAMLTMLSAVAELEREIISENTLENRIALTKKNIPASGNLPFGRTYENGKWGIDEKIQKKIKWAASKYAMGESIKSLAKKLQMSQSGLLRNLKTRCGSIWTVSFKDEEYELDVPPLLDDEMIAAVHRRAALNKTTSHGFIKNEYLLSRNILCGHCGYAMFGQTDTHHRENRYYRHPKIGANQCKDFPAFVKADDIEKAVMVHLFRMYGDVNNIKKAIDKALPNKEEIKNDKIEKDNYEKELNVLKDEKGRLIRRVRKGIFMDCDIEREMNDIRARERFLESEIERVNSKTANSPKKEEIEEDADSIKQMIRIAHATDCRLGKMTFEDKRVIVEKAFGGIKDVDGKRLGVYIKTGSNGKLQYEINGGIVKCIDEDLPKSFLELPMPHYALHELLNIETDYAGKDYDPFVQEEVTMPKRKIRKNRNKVKAKQEIHRPGIRLNR